jgi:hypothetical protein
MTYLELQQRMAEILAAVADGEAAEDQIDELVEAAGKAASKVDFAGEQIDEAKAQQLRLKRQGEQVQVQRQAWARAEKRWKERVRYWTDGAGVKSLSGERWRVSVANGGQAVDLVGDPPPDLRRIHVEMSEADWESVRDMLDGSARVTSGPEPWISRISERLKQGEQMACARLKPTTRVITTRS